MGDGRMGDGRMGDGKHDGHLGGAYDATSPQEVAALYDRWAQSYDGDMAIAGYRHPTICLALIARHLPRGAGPVLDAGAGTGLIGEWLRIVGYGPLEALDISQGMLDVARAKGLYDAYHCLALGSALPFADGSYAGIVSSGVFTTGHVGPNGLDELVRITRPGGVLVLTVKTTLWADGIEARIAQFEAEGHVRRLEQTAPYVSMPGETGTIPSLAVVLGRH